VIINPKNITTKIRPKRPKLFTIRVPFADRLQMPASDYHPQEHLLMPASVQMALYYPKLADLHIQPGHQLEQVGQQLPGMRPPDSVTPTGAG